MVFVADDLGAWLIGLLADAGRKKLISLVLGTDQERALRLAAVAAVERTAEQLAPSGGEQAEQLARVVSEVFREPTPDAAVARQATLLEALQAGIADKLAVLDDPDVTGIGQSSTELLGVPGGALAETLAGYLVREIMVRASRGGPLVPLANQLNHDAIRLQGQRLEGVLAGVADQVTALARTGSATVASQPVRLLPRAALLAGREDLLADLDARLTGAGEEGPRMVALCGLGGAGKTSVALEYAHRHLTEVGVAWQFAAEDPTMLAAGFAELAAQLGARDVAGIRDPVTSVHGVLAAYPRQWLLVFDNTPDRSAVEKFLPPAGRRGQVLITSQNQNWPAGQVVDVPVLDTEVAAAFLVSRTGDADGQAAARLAALLGGLPLALEQAAAFIQATGESLADYLALFGQRRADLLSRGKPTGYGKTVATTWALAFERLDQSVPGATGLLRLLACCAPEAIPWRLLLQSRSGLTERLGDDVAAALGPLLDDPLAASDAIAALRQYSLVTLAGAGSVSVHRLVQAVTADQMPADDLANQWRQAAAALIEAAIPADTDLPETWPVCAALLPHARAALADDSVGLDRLANYLGERGSYVAALELQQRIVDARERSLGPQNRETLIGRANLAHLTGAAGDAAGACDQYAALLPVEERVLGPEDRDTLTGRGNLAFWTGAAGDAAGARDQYAALLPVLEQVLGPEDRSTLTTKARLARWTGQAGDAAGARDQYAALLPVLEQVLGPEHPSTLITRNDLAALTGLVGDAAGARDQYAALLPVRERVSGPEHPETLTTQNNLASWTGQAGDAAGARDQLAALLPMLEQVLGPEHPDTLTCRSNHAFWTGQAGDAAGARDQLAALLPVLEQVLGPEDRSTLTDRANLAFWTGQAGDAARARDRYAALLPVRERVSGPEHPETLTTRANLAACTGAAGDAARARDQYAALLPVLEQVLGPEHPGTLTTRANLTHWSRQAGDAEPGVK